MYLPGDGHWHAPRRLGVASQAERGWICGVARERGLQGCVRMGAPVLGLSGCAVSAGSLPCCLGGK